MLMSFAVDGFAFAAESLTGKYIGAKNKKMLHRSIKYAFSWGWILAALAAVVYWVAYDDLLYLFTDNEEVVAAATPYLYWVILMPLLSIGAFMWDGIYVGATASVAMRNTMMAATFLFYLPAYYVLQPYIGNHALWLALCIFMVARTLLQTALAKRHIYDLLD